MVSALARRAHHAGRALTLTIGASNEEPEPQINRRRHFVRRDAPLATRSQRPLHGTLYRLGTAATTVASLSGAT
jgi:hypothetical protein